MQPKTYPRGGGGSSRTTASGTGWMRFRQSVVPANSTGIEIVEPIGVGVSRQVPGVAFVPAILSFVFPNSGRSPDRDPCLATPDRWASTTDSQTETEILR